MREFAIIGTRLLGAYLLMVAVSTGLGILGSIVLLAPTLSEPGSFLGSSWAIVMSQVLLAVVGGVLVLRSRWLAKLFARGLVDVQFEKPTNQQLVQVGTFLIGLFFVAGGIAQFLVAAWRVWVHITFHGPSPYSLFKKPLSNLRSIGFGWSAGAHRLPLELR